MAKATVIKGGWWWLEIERRIGDEVDASDVQIARWADEGLVRAHAEVPADIETATAPPHETAVRPRKRR